MSKIVRIKKFFDDPSIPIIVVVRSDNKEALFDKDKQENITPFKEYDFFVYGSIEQEVYVKSGKKILIANGKNESFLIIDNEIVDSIKKFEFNYLTLPINDKFICVQKNENENREAIYDIQKKEIITPFFNSIYPSIYFPKIPYYKAYTKNSGYAIFSFPNNKQLTDFHYDISSVDVGLLGGKNKYYSTKDSTDKFSVYEKFKKLIISDIDRNTYKDLFNNLDIKLNERKIIERLFN